MHHTCSSSTVQAEESERQKRRVVPWAAYSRPQAERRRRATLSAMVSSSTGWLAVCLVMLMMSCP